MIIAEEFTPEMSRALAEGKATIIAHPDLIDQLRKCPAFVGIKMRAIDVMDPTKLVAVLDDAPSTP